MILTRAGQLPALHATDEEPLEDSRIYIAPPDRHLLVHNGAVRLSRGPRENGHRPAIDPLFRTAAHQHGAAAIGLVLSGVLDDGSAGLRVLRGRGGVAIVQDPSDALYSAMPENAISHAEPQYVLPMEAIPPVLIDLVTANRTERGATEGEAEPVTAANVNEASPNGALVATHVPPVRRRALGAPRRTPRAVRMSGRPSFHGRQPRGRA